MIVQILCMNTMSVLAAKETNEEVEVSLSTNKSEYEQGEEIELKYQISLLTIVLMHHTSRIVKC